MAVRDCSKTKKENTRPQSTLTAKSHIMTHNVGSNRVVMARMSNNKKTPEGAHAGRVGLRKNYGYVEWQWKVE